MLRRVYARKSKYDPSTGSFTQEDPIGLAGGLNLYGCTGGDPINFSDPFGLCPESLGGDGKTRVLSDCPEGSEGHKIHQALSKPAATDATTVASEEDQAEHQSRMECTQGRVLTTATQGAAVGRVAGAVAGGAFGAVRMGRTFGVAGAVLAGAPTGGVGTPYGFVAGATVGVVYGAVTGTSNG